MKFKAKLAADGEMDSPFLIAQFGRGECIRENAARLASKNRLTLLDYFDTIVDKRSW
jgi:hypothetical protein